LDHYFLQTVQEWGSAAISIVDELESWRGDPDEHGARLEGLAFLFSIRSGELIREARDRDLDLEPIRELCAVVDHWDRTRDVDQLPDPRCLRRMLTAAEVTLEAIEERSGGRSIEPVAVNGPQPKSNNPVAEAPAPDTTTNSTMASADGALSLDDRATAYLTKLLMQYKRAEIQRPRLKAIAEALKCSRTTLYDSKVCPTFRGLWKQYQSKCYPSSKGKRKSVPRRADDTDDDDR
jgi:hypothetical protein